MKVLANYGTHAVVELSKAEFDSLEIQANMDAIDLEDFREMIREKELAYDEMEERYIRVDKERESAEAKLSKFEAVLSELYDKLKQII